VVCPANHCHFSQFKRTVSNPIALEGEERAVTTTPPKSAQRQPARGRGMRFDGNGQGCSDYVSSHQANCARGLQDAPPECHAKIVSRFKSVDLCSTIALTGQCLFFMFASVCFCFCCPMFMIIDNDELCSTLEHRLCLMTTS